MNFKFKSIISIILVLVIVLSMGITVFAARATGKAMATSGSKLLMQRTCTFKNLSTNKITVENNGTVKMYVYINDTFFKEIRPGKQCTYSQYGYKKKKFNVEVYSVGIDRRNSQYITIKTTSGTIK